MAARKKPTRPAAGCDMPAFIAALDKLQQTAIGLGAASERARIAAIMNAAATGQRALAWEFALAGTPIAMAIEALEIAKISAALPAIDAGAAYIH